MEGKDTCRAAKSEMAVRTERSVGPPMNNRLQRRRLTKPVRLAFADKRHITASNGDGYRSI
jgi:hypothetical protein